jgi:hypothetical protein
MVSPGVRGGRGCRFDSPRTIKFLPARARDEAGRIRQNLIGGGGFRVTKKTDQRVCASRGMWSLARSIALKGRSQPTGLQYPVGLTENSSRKTAIQLGCVQVAVASRPPPRIPARSARQPQMDPRGGTYSRIPWRSLTSQPASSPTCRFSRRYAHLGTFRLYFVASRVTALRCVLSYN